MAPTMKLGYWEIRGYAEPIRTLLHYCKVPFEDVRYGFGSGADFPSMNEWFKVKPSMGLDFPNLPYLITDTGCKITQVSSL